MKATNIHSFYSLGIALELLYSNISVDKLCAEVFMYVVEPCNLLLQFLDATRDMPIDDTRNAALYLQKYCFAFYNSMKDPKRAEQKITQNEVSMFIGGKEQFEKAFEREYRNLDVFTVMKKGIYDTRLLIRSPEEEVPERLRRLLPQQTIDDWKQAGRCLAFEIPTACAFHICRGTEALMLRYYEVLAKHAWSRPKKDWNIYIEHLRKEGAPPTITTRLNEIRDMDRNAYTHPEKSVSLDESPVLFRLCTGVTYYMCLELEKLNP